MILSNKENCLKLFFVSDGRSETDYCFAVAKVDPLIREAIKKNNDKMLINLQCCHVSDRIHLIQCYTCQKFGHKAGSPYCKHKNSDNVTCLYCSRNHRSKECPHKRNSNYFECSNCHSSSNPTIKEKARGHTYTTTSDKCPFFQTELHSVLTRTLGFDSKNYMPRSAIII